MSDAPVSIENSLGNSVQGTHFWSESCRLYKNHNIVSIGKTQLRQIIGEDLPCWTKSVCVGIVRPSDWEGIEETDRGLEEQSVWVSTERALKMC